MRIFFKPIAQDAWVLNRFHAVDVKTPQSCCPCRKKKNPLSAGWETCIRPSPLKRNKRSIKQCLSNRV